jgi:ornithine cyclodeaminase/alanine dehydrogenase-like protein (mu-crystallin family)
MAILLRESDVERLATMRMALDAVEQAFQEQGKKQADNAPRRRCRLHQGLLHVMSASLPSFGYAGLKSYTSVSGQTRFLVHLYDSAGELLAIMEAARLGQLRTGAASGVATKYMARKDSSRAGIFGTGFQARSQLEALSIVRPIKTIVAYSPDADRRKAFCEEMSEKLQIGVYPADSPKDVVKDADILITATDSKVPVFDGAWLSPSVHINAIGCNFLTRQEIDVETVRRCACVVVDSVEQARLEAGDLTRAAEADAFYWEDASELGLVVVGEFPGREDDSEITLFKSHGIALEDVALAARIYEAARQDGAGETLKL